MPTTDNMRVTITKKNFSITFTTSFPGVTFYSATVTSTATSGTFTGMKLVVNASGIGGSLDGLVVEAHSQAATTGIVWLNGAYILAECDSGKYVETFMMGLYLKVAAASDSSVANVAGLYIDYYIQHSVGGEAIMLYLRNNAPTKPPASYIAMYGGADYIIDFKSAAQGEGASGSGDKTGGGAQGWIRVNYAGSERFIQLYAAA